MRLAARILAVDDEPSNLLLLERILKRAGYTHVDTIRRSSQVQGYFERHPPDLLLLDLHMPDPDGFAVMRLLERWTSAPTNVPVLVLTADAGQSTRHRALEAGANDFLVKPLDQTEVLLRAGNLLKTHQLQVELRAQNASLDAKVRRRTGELNDARLEAFRKLSVAGEYRDDETRQHTQRVGHMAGLIALELGMDNAAAEILREVAPLHDLGKIGIPDAILLKPGRLSDQEFAAMKEHTRIGAGILGGTRSPFFTIAEQVALSHHERWDGSGYPQGLAGERIPLEARIVGLVDAFDAMSHQRPYKSAWPLDQTLDEIERSSGSHFDARIVDAFRRLDHTSLLNQSPDRPAPALSSSAWQVLRESEAGQPESNVFEALLEQPTYALLIATDERYCIAANAAALDLLGVVSEKLRHRRIDDLATPDHRNDLDAIWHDFRRSRTDTADGVLRGRDGGRVNVRYEMHTHLLPGYPVTVLAWLSAT
jgi:putative two-component system response regulator